MVSKILKFGKQEGSSLALPAHGWVGARATSSLAAHFAKRNTKFGGGGKIGIGKRGRAKIPSPQPPSFLSARAFGFSRAKRGNQSEFRSKKVRASFSNCDQSKHFKFSGERVCSLAPPEFIPHGDAGAGLASQKALPSCAFSATAGKYFEIKSKGRTNSNSVFRESKRRFGVRSTQ